MMTTERSRKRKAVALGKRVQSWALRGPGRRVVRALKLSGLAKKMYWFFFHPLRGWRTLRFGDLQARFAVGNFENLFYVDNVANKNIDEMHFLRALANALGPGDSFYDVGASVGIFSILIAKRVGPHGYVVAFEPENRSFNTLCKNTTLNHLSNVLLFRLGLGDRAAMMALAMKTSLGFRSSSVVRAPSDAILHKVEIESGDALRLSLCLPIPRAVKIDVEGYEAQVLEGLKETLALPQCRCLCCEVHPSLLTEGMSPAMLLEFIGSLGFDKVEIVPRQSELHLIATKAEGEALRA